MKLTTSFRYLAASVCSLLLSAEPAGASTTPATTVRQVVAENGAFFVYVNATPSSDAPSCAATTSANHRYAIDPSTPSGAAMIAIALTAYAAQTSIYIVGTGACTVWADTETVSYIGGLASGS
jgi:hypothetical protein